MCMMLTFLSLPSRYILGNPRKPKEHPDMDEELNTPPSTPATSEGGVGELVTMAYNLDVRDGAVREESPELPETLILDFEPDTPTPQTPTGDSWETLHMDLESLGKPSQREAEAPPQTTGQEIEGTMPMEVTEDEEPNEQAQSEQNQDSEESEEETTSGESENDDLEDIPTASPYEPGKKYCFICLGSGHDDSECTGRPPIPSSHSSYVPSPTGEGQRNRCPKCRSRGHFIQNCPKKLEQAAKARQE